RLRQDLLGRPVAGPRPRLRRGRPEAGRPAPLRAQPQPHLPGGVAADARRLIPGPHLREIHAADAVDRRPRRRAGDPRSPRALVAGGLVHARRPRTPAGPRLAPRPSGRGLSPGAARPAGVQGRGPGPLVGHSAPKTTAPRTTLAAAVLAGMIEPLTR